MRLRTGMNERLLEAERGVPISPPPAALRRAVSAVLQSGQEKVVQRSASRMHERLGPQHTRWGVDHLHREFRPSWACLGPRWRFVPCTGNLTIVCLLGAAADQVGVVLSQGVVDVCLLA